MHDFFTFNETKILNSFCLETFVRKLETFFM